MTIVKVVIHAVEDREGREDYGRKQKMTITGKQFAYIIHEIDDFRGLFGYLNSQGDWVDVK